MNDAPFFTPQRTVEFLPTEVDRRQALINEVGVEEFYKAIGYLATWASTSNSYPKVQISFFHYNDWPPEIGAIYRTKEDKVGYTIHAVFDRDSKQFGFHS